MSGRYGIHDSRLPDHVIIIMVLIAIWLVQNLKSKNAVHLTGHKDSGIKQILREKWRPYIEGSIFRDFSVPPGHMAGHMACMIKVFPSSFPVGTENFVLKTSVGELLHNRKVSEWTHMYKVYLSLHI